jgi:hypothetical protein
VVLLTQLRNTLVHYVPETTSNDATEVQRIETQLRSKFKPNPLPGENVVGPFFPDRCLGLPGVMPYPFYRQAYQC